MSALPIGVFDSGLGGLTVVRELRRHAPQESILYLGDTARVPYGTRSAATVVRYARGCAGLLSQRGVKALVVACNTASSVALDVLREELGLPVLGVIEPGARAAVNAARALSEQLGHPVRIGVLGTTSTVASGAYPREVHRIAPELEVEMQAAPLFVSLAEEGWLTGEVPRLAAERYLSPLIERSVRVLVLGCTHYPLLKPVIEQVANQLSQEPVVIVDSAEATALVVRDLVQGMGTVSKGTPAALQLLVTDVPGSFADSAARFLGEPVNEPTVVDVVPA